MKNKIVVIISIMLISACSFAGTTPNAAVLKTFNEKFPTATDVKWGMETKTEFEADFKVDGKSISANFAADGSWLETEMQIPVSELPKPVADAIQKQYPGFQILEADKTETAKHGTIYEADIKSGSIKKALAYKEDGTTVIE